jgi:membrane protein YqaA with SNARE-associated domain
LPASSLTLSGLFLSAFLSATLLPGSSEALLAALLLEGETGVTLLLLAATGGNLLGSLMNWLLGSYGARFRGRRWFPVTQESYARAERWFARFGSWSLLFAWLPVVGDPLTVAAGLLRVPFWRFFILVGIGKAARYLFIAAAALALI